MARIVYATVLITLIIGSVGCQQTGPIVPTSDRPINEQIPPGVSETELVEEMTINRQAYETGLKRLVTYYSNTGNNLKLEWARKELKSFNTMPKYVYIIGPTPGLDYQATQPIATADDMFYRAQGLEKDAGPVIGMRDKNTLRLALREYEQLIKDYPSSDKIDDAAFQAGIILEELGDYVVALQYFQSAFEWNTETPYPARFKAAYILDRHMHRYSEAVVLYNEALKIEARFDKYRQWKEFAERRIRELQKLDEGEN